MTPLDAFGSERQYWHHLLPIWQALDVSERGLAYCRADLVDWLRGQVDDPEQVRPGYPHGRNRTDDPVLVASYQDHRSSQRPTVYVEHGAGQTYGADPSGARDPSYSGGSDHERTVLFLCPSETVAQRWRDAYPATPAVAVGVPKLDAWHHARGALPSGSETAPRAYSSAFIAARTAPTVALSFHARVPLCQESSSAYPYYDLALPSIVADLRYRGIEVLGHGHPRYWSKLEPRWRAMGVEPVADFLDLLDRIDCYVIDNSSTMYEAASCDVPIVAMNCPAYRRDVHHGMRFWNQIPGLQCDGPDDLVDTIVAALTDPPDVAAARRAIVGQVYVACDGRATERSVAAIRALLA